MQIFAYHEKKIIRLAEAEKGKNYYCPQCNGVVHLRSGRYRSSHFYHLKKTKSCRLAQKGEIHLRLQKFIHYLFEDEAEMEKSFPSIGRIADVALMQSKRIYEIQYSLMTEEEARSRCADYESIGYQVIWILHDDLYNQKKMRPVERFLQSKICYYSNMDEEGSGMIYDFLPGYGKRPVNLRYPKKMPTQAWPSPLNLKAHSKDLYHEGDFFDLAIKNQFKPKVKSLKLSARIKQMYLALLNQLLAKSCK